MEYIQLSENDPGADPGKTEILWNSLEESYRLLSDIIVKCEFREFEVTSDDFINESSTG